MHRQTLYRKKDPQANIQQAKILTDIFIESIDKEHNKLRERLDKNEIIEACKKYLNSGEEDSDDARLDMEEAFLHTKYAIDAYAVLFLDKKNNKVGFTQINKIEEELHKETPSIDKLVELCEFLKLTISIETNNKKFEFMRNNIAVTSNFTYTDVVTKRGCTIL